MKKYSRDVGNGGLLFTGACRFHELVGPIADDCRSYHLQSSLNWPTIVSDKVYEFLIRCWYGIPGMEFVLLFGVANAGTGKSRKFDGKETGSLQVECIKGSVGTDTHP